MTSKRVVVVGGGITGLTFASTLVDELSARGRNPDVQLIETSPQAGGHARTIIEDGFVVESGPNGFLDREPAALELVTRLGLDDRVVEASASARRRFIVRSGTLLQVPDSPVSFIASPSLSARAKVRLLREPWASGPPPDVDETVFEFATRRLGREVAETFVDTVVSGISGGDSRELSLRSMFPVLHQWETEHGSLLKAAFAQPRRTGGRTKLLSFDQGLGVLTSALAGRLGARVITGVSVTALDRDSSAWRVSLSTGQALTADHVVMATPAHVSTRLLQSTAPALSGALAAIPYVGLAVVALAFHKRSIPRALDGYGYLVPRSEKLATMGVLWESSIFPHRAPADHVLLRAMLGGTSVPTLARLDEKDLVKFARRDLETIMGVSVDAAPLKQWVFRWPRAIAQYTVGHHERMRSITSALAETPGLNVCGTAYHGVSFVSAIAGASQAARVQADLLANETSSA